MGFFDNQSIQLLTACIIICIIIGLPTFLSGCDPNGSKCISKNSFKGKIYDSTIIPQSCSKCTTHDSNNHCTHTIYYTCYDSFVYARKDDSQDTCFMQTGNDVTYSTAYNANLNYPDGKSVKWFKNKGSNECVTTGNAYALWITGVFFLALGGAFLLCCGCLSTSMVCRGEVESPIRFEMVNV